MEPEPPFLLPFSFFLFIFLNFYQALVPRVLKFCLADFVYLIQELRSDCVHLSNKYAKIVMSLPITVLYSIGLESLENFQI